MLLLFGNEISVPNSPCRVALEPVLSATFLHR